ncbi:MAG: hypothetical protein JWO15_1323, partial [Sphingomonadales bacterium]|nr:hypothetical protein [Sphingomonadales bacterium]
IKGLKTFEQGIEESEDKMTRFVI